MFENHGARRPAIRLLGLLLIPGIALACGGGGGGGEETTGPGGDASGSAAATIQMTSSSSGYGSGTSYDFSPRMYGTIVVEQ